MCSVARGWVVGERWGGGDERARAWTPPHPTPIPTPPHSRLLDVVPVVLRRVERIVWVVDSRATTRLGRAAHLYSAEGRFGGGVKEGKDGAQASMETVDAPLTHHEVEVMQQLLGRQG